MRHPQAPARSTSRPPIDFALFLATAAVLLIALTIGGASQVNLVQVCIVEAAALPLLLFSLWAIGARRGWQRLLGPMGLVGALAAVCLLQLVPLPPNVWAAVAGHSLAADALAQTGLVARWRPYTLAPGATLKCFLALIPPAAVLLATTLLPHRYRRWLAATLVLFTLFSIVVGLLQVGHGWLDFYGTAGGYSTGFFANRNHQASLLVSTLPLIAYMASAEHGSLSRFRVARMLIAGGAAVVIMAGLIVVKSRAGVLLLGPALLLSLALLVRTQVRTVNTRVIAVGALALIITGAAGIVAAAPFLDRFSHGGLQDVSRSHIALTVARLGVRYLPFGSGVGSFVPVHNGAETLDDMSTMFWNHAHNEYVEVWLEAGFVAVAILLAFAIWAGRRAAAAWLVEINERALTASAGSIMIVLLMIHSAVDYPLRTLGLACVFAYACALLAGMVQEERGQP